MSWKFGKKLFYQQWHSFVWFMLPIVNRFAKKSHPKDPKKLYSNKFSFFGSLFAFICFKTTTTNLSKSISSRNISKIGSYHSSQSLKSHLKKINC